MTAAGSIQGKLKEIKPLYETVVRLQAQWEELQSVEVAYTAYRTYVTEIEQELDLHALKKRKAEREQELYVLQEGEDSLPQEQPVYFTPPPRGVDQKEKSKDSPHRSDPPTVPPDKPPNQEMILAARHELKRLVPRLALAWQLDTNLQGRINRVVDDRTRPLGEALSLLKWNAYEDRTRTRESESDHLRRLTEWEEALKEYREWLERQISNRKFQYKDFLHIWRLWQSRNTDEGQRSWQSQMDSEAKGRRQEARNLQADIADIERDIGDLRSRTTPDRAP